MTIRIGLMGFGRIGRNMFRILYNHDDVQVVAISDIADHKGLEYLLKWDTIMGRFPAEVRVADGYLYTYGRQIRMLSGREPGDVNWAELGVDIVVEATARYRSRKEVARHLDAGAKRVILCVPPIDPPDITVVMGVNDDELRPDHHIISNASATAHCAAPILKLIDEAFGVERLFFNTVHAYTNDQRLADVPHKDFRRSRAAAENIIPTTTGAARAVGKVLPELNGKLDGIAARVPVPDGSVVDLVVKLARKPDRDAINAAVKEAAAGPLKAILEYSEVPLVSSDIIGNPHSSIFDSLMTHSMDDGYARVLSWYDNEWGYSNRCVDLIRKMAALDA